MFLVGMIQWWYGAGLWRHIKLSGLGILRTADFFSVGLLARTLFNPFRQISAGQVNGPLPLQLQAFFDRLFSRVIGFFVRSMVIICGLVVIVVRCAWTLVSIMIWVLLPILPLIGLILWQMGVAP